MTSTLTRATATIALIGVLLGASMASAAARTRHHRHRGAVQHHRHHLPREGSVRAVGRVLPIVAGSDKVKVDRAGQVIVDGQP